METYRLAVIEGDGIGREVVPEGLAAIRAAADVTGSFAIETVGHPWSCEYYATHGRMMDDDALERLADSDAIFLGAIGFPGVPDHVSLWNMLLPVRQAALFRWCLAEGLRVVKPMTLMTMGEYRQPSGSYFVSVLY